MYNMVSNFIIINEVKQVNEFIIKKHAVFIYRLSAWHISIHGGGINEDAS